MGGGAIVLSAPPPPGAEQAPAGRGRVCGSSGPGAPQALPLIPVGYETSLKKLQSRNLAAEASVQTQLQPLCCD